ncbi:hypothetical protein Golomagni_06348 [Golovinomyces magnicellulatus]|nr:hypothetical protein Golomagni_06348 [Golovinomyces magnicellulatus]
MSFGSHFSANPSNGVIVFKGTQNYLEWLYTIKMASNVSSETDIKNVWKYIDPKISSKPNLPTVPARPTPVDINPTTTTISKLATIELEYFKYKNTIWREQKLDVQDIERRLEAVQNKILGSISETLIPQLKSSSTARKQEVILKWNALKNIPANREILPWRDQWEIVYGEAKELKLSVV